MPIWRGIARFCFYKKSTATFCTCTLFDRAPLTQTILEMFGFRTEKGVKSIRCSKYPLKLLLKLQWMSNFTILFGCGRVKVEILFFFFPKWIELIDLFCCHCGIDSVGIILFLNIFQFSWLTICLLFQSNDMQTEIDRTCQSGKFIFFSQCL